MSKVILISCVSLKRNVKCEAQYLYISPLFVKSLQYAKLQNPDKIFILSAKYGLVKCDDIIEPYNVTLKNFSKKESKNGYSFLRLYNNNFCNILE